MTIGIIRDMRKVLRLVLLLTACSAVIGSAGCRGGGTTSAGPPTDNIFRVAMVSEPTTLDPAMVQDGTTIDLLQNIYEGLVMWTPDNKLAPCLADRWTVSPDGLTYTFHLRPGVKFQSGAPLTARDVAYSLKRSLSPELGSPVALTYLGDILGATEFATKKSSDLKGVSVVDPSTVRVKISKPKAYWLDVLTYPTAYVVNAAAVAKDSAGHITAANADGTGPFKLTSYQRGSAVDLQAFTGYWAGAPKIAGQHRPLVSDANTRHSLYVSGQLDIVDETQGTLAADLQNPDYKSQVKLWPRAATWYVAFGEGR